MSKYTLYILMSGILLVACSTETKKTSIQKTSLNYFENPLGIDDPEPRFSWVATSEGHNKMQSAYRILVAASVDDLDKEIAYWDSGKVTSDENTHIRYQGKALQSGQKYYYKIMIWDEKDAASDWSDNQYWVMGLLKEEDWKAEWIGFKTVDTNKKDTLNLPPPAYLKKEFTTEAKVKSAILHCTALGVYEPMLNGQKISEDILTPGWSDYTRRVYYNTYDVGNMIKEGNNTLKIILADGWYSGYVGPKELSNPKNRELYGEHPAFLGQLDIEYENGEKRTIVSDMSWKGREGPLIYADLLMGTGYNANLEIENQGDSGSDSKVWKDVYAHPGTKGVLEAYPGNTIQVYDTLKPQEIKELTEGTYIFDLGQNFAGRTRLRVKGNKNDTLILRHGEMLYPDGFLMTENLRFARAKDMYILKGDGTEIWEPKFTYHGFRYVEVSGLSEKPTKETLTGIAFSSATPMESSFTSSDSILNRMYENIRWTQRSNFMDVPTDSPQRDERLGWLGDIQIFSKSALYNANLGAFFSKWFVDLRDAQYEFGPYANFAPQPYPELVWYSPGWMEAGVMVPYNTYKFYGDTKMIADHYESMRRFMDYHIEKSSEAGYFYPENSWTEIGPKGGFGDWLSMTDKNLAHDLMASMYFQTALRMMAEMSAALDKPEEEAYYQKVFDISISNFMEHYMNEDGIFKIDESAYGDGEGYFEGFKGFTGHTQSAYATAIYFDLLPDEQEKKAGRHLTDLLVKNDTLPTSGILGIRQLLPALSKIGRSDLAYQILLNKAYPGWGFQVKHGATTIWERWNSYTPKDGFNGEMNTKMNSFNHYAFGAFSQFLFEQVGGIRAEGVGFDSIVIRPELGDGSLKSAAVRYASLNGEIGSTWKLEGPSLLIEIDIPFNTTAEVYVPTKAGGKVSETTGASIEKTFSQNIGDTKYEVYKVGSGHYEFESQIP